MYTAALRPHAAAGDGFRKASICDCVCNGVSPERPGRVGRMSVTKPGGSSGARGKRMNKVTMPGRLAAEPSLGGAALQEAMAEFAVDQRPPRAPGTAQGALRCLSSVHAVMRPGSEW